MDILFQEFINSHYDDLSESEKQGFDRLLDEADLDIMNWIMGKNSPDSDQLNHIVNIIRDARHIH